MCMAGVWLYDMMSYSRYPLEPSYPKAIIDDKRYEHI